MAPPQLARKALRRARTSDSVALQRSFYGMRSVYRYLGRTVPFLHWGWVAHLRGAHWDGDTFVVSGWAYARGIGYDDTPVIEVEMRRRGSAPIRAEVQSVANLDANALARGAEFDYANTGFVARLDLSALNELDPADSEGKEAWATHIRVAGADRVVSGPFRVINRWASPGIMAARPFGSNVMVNPHWHDRHGLLIGHHRVGVVMDSADVVDRAIALRLSRSDAATHAAIYLRGAEQIEAELLRSETDETLYTGIVPVAMPVIDEVSGAVSRSAWSLEVGTGRRARPVYTMDPQFGRIPDESSPLLLRADTSGHVECVEAPGYVDVTDAEFTDDGRRGVRISGRFAPGAEPLGLDMVGPRFSIPVEVTEHDDHTFAGFVPLDVSVWNGPALPPPLGGYTLARRFAGGYVPTFVDPSFGSTLARKIDRPDMRLRLEMNHRGGFRVAIARPRRNDELGSLHQRRLLADYAATDFVPQDAVYFESFFGRNATCNPRALDRLVADRHPEMTRYWGVSDFSVPVPPGAIAVVTGTKEWWQARGSSRYIITNEWLRTRFRKQPFQTVLQTWHGSMYKKIGLDREGMGKRHVNMLLAERANWDYFVSQNAPGTEVIGRAYAFETGVLETGYPRNDELVGADRDAIRQKLGIKPETVVVMYAPTWRETQGGIVDFLDLAQLSAALGDDYLIYLRGHVRTLAHGAEIKMDRVVDVSTYPNIADLYVAADVMITDYSSMMFDYSVTRKPMVFFAPDIDEYTDSKVRGAYFDLVELAPGPVVRTQDEVVAELRALDSYDSRFADKYVAWNTMFNHLDDGHASERVLDSLFKDR